METRTFRLSSYDISPSNNLADYYKQTVTTQYGTVADNRMSLTWNNVNLQQIVGDDFFNAYNRFTIRLVNQAWFGTSSSDSGTAYSAQNYQDTFVNVYLKGLPFYPPAYNSPDGALVNTLDLGLLSITTGQTFGRTQNANSINRTFLKTNSASLSINIRSVATEQPFSPADIPTNLWGHSVYHFEITGIPDVSNVSYVDLTNSSVLESGSQTIYTELTPTDTFNYTGSSRVNNVFVTSTASSVSFAASRPSSIVYETDLTNILIATVGEINGVTPTGVMKFFKDSTFEDEVTTSTILDYGIYTIYARFTPDSSNFADSFTSTALIVIQKSTVLSYSAQSSVVYGSGDTAVLNASSTVPGTVAYFYDAANTLPIKSAIDVGSYTVYAVFTPTSTNYLSSTASSSFTVTQASSSLSYSAPDAITYGTTIAASLIATTAATGTTNYYKNSAHTQLISPSDIFNAGTYTIYAVFSPSSSNYLPSNASASLTVNKASTSISFPVIPSIVYGTTLSNFIAGTVATNIAGALSFNIDSASGTSLSSSSVLHVGTYTIYAKFTPTDTANYLIAESTIPLSVTSLATTIEYSSPLTASVVYSSNLTSVLATTVTPNVSGTVSYYYGTNTVITTSTSLNVGTYDIYAVFTPSTADYASSTTVTPVTLTVTQATPTIIYENLSSIAYETTLSSSLIATSPVAGSFEYYLNSNKTNKVTSTTLLAAGTYTVYAFLTPSSSNYTSASQGASLTVNKLSPQFDYTITSSIVYGATVAQALSASSSVLGSILYYLDSANTELISSTDVFDAGLYTIYAVFSPADNLNYESATKSASLTVDRKATAISFPNISSFVYETTLQAFVEGTTSVNSVAGLFNFYINNLSGTALSSSTVLSVGTYTIFCQFVPTDSTNYLTATKTKSLTVTKHGTSISFTPSIPSSINYGTTLSQILSTSVTPSVAGSVKFYKDAAFSQEVIASTVLDYGSYAIYAVFTPTSGDYNVSSTSTSLSVTKIATTVTYPALSNIVYGTTLASSFTASVSPSIQGAFNYYYKVGSTNISLSPSYVLNAGSYTIYVDFVPNSSSYLGSSSQQSLVVTTLATSVIYDTLPNIVYLTTLASSLNAVAFPNVSGSMKYYIDSLQVSPTKVLTPGSYSITAIFTPTSVNYSSSTTTKSLTVTKIPPAITFPNISTFVYGTTLENFLSGVVTDVSGTFEFFLNDANGTSISSSTVLDAGTYTIFSRFTPTETTYHKVSTATKILTVSQIATSLSYSPSIASSIVYETTLADILQTSVTPVLPGTTVYTVNGTVVTSSTLMNVGTHVITATFTPTDPDYAQSTATTSLTVTAASTSLSYSIPSTIVYGTTLNSSLIATCTKPGTIAYFYDSLYTSPATSSDVPNVGSYTLYAVFTPSTSNYLGSNASVNLTVSVQTTTLAFSPSVPSVITYETMLADIFSASVTPSAAGTISYYYMNGGSRVDLSVHDILAIGNYTIQAEFTPASSNSGSSSTSTALLVTQKPVVVNFSGLSAITYGTSLASSLTATVSHPITGTLSYYTDSSLNSEVTASTVLNAGSYIIYAKFTPSSSNYVSYTVNTGLTVNKATPVVTYGFLPSIAYGTTLQTSFTASANIAGTIAYFLLNDPIVASQILNAGSYTLRAQFTPTNTANYNSTFATSSLTVRKITPTVSMASIAPITYETTLASFISATTASVSGTFSFYLADSTVVTSSTVLDAGTYTIYSSFVPTNTTNYNSMIMASASLQVLKKTTSITLSAISTFGSGVSMSSFISGTSASGPGTLSFYLSNASGQQLNESSVLTSGSYTIYCTFTPTNTTNYFSANASKIITIQGGPDAVPTAILFSSLDSVVYGTTMAQFISQTTASADGTLSFFVNDAQGQQITSSTVLNAGFYTIFCAFTSASPSEFLSTTSFKSFTVEKVPTTVTMSTISTFAYGTTMASFMNGTTTSVSGTKTFYINDPSGQLLASSTAITVGSVTIYCKFEPTDTNYASSFATKQLIVTQKQMTVTYGPLSAITYGTKLTSRLTASFSPIADGSMNYYVNSVLVNSSTVLDANTHTITATFSPASSNYLGASATASLVVNKAATVVTYPTLPSVFFNGPIGTGSLCATVIPDISGTMAYFTNSTFTNQVFATTTLTQGTYTLYARFTPLSTNYAVSSASSTLLVKGITTPTITFPNTTTVAAYTTLESFINGTSAGVAGTFVFRKNNSSGEILTATSTFNTLGNFVVFCSFAPTNTELYLPATASTTVVVKFTPSFLFNQRPSSTITYGTNLSGTVLATTVGQFNNANIAGTITFSNNLTTASILTPGIYTVTATFTPTSSNEYNTVTTTKQVLVTKQDIMIMITSPSVKSAFIKSTPIDCSYQVFGIISAVGDTFQNSVYGTIVNKYMSFDESTVLTAQYVYNTTFSGSSQNYKIAADISGFSSTKYNLTSQSYTFTMNKYTPTISYAIAAGNKTVTYGSKLAANQLNAVVTYNGVAVNTGSIVYTRSAINMAQTVDTQTALDIGQYNLYAYYSDPSGNIYNSVNTASITSNLITVVKATPVISFPNIKSILAGTDLNNILGFTVANFNSAIIDGTFIFSYVNQSGATVVLDTTSVLTRPPSSFTIDALFTPLDTARYNTATSSLTITVSDQLTTLTPTTLIQSPIIYGKNFNQLYSFSVSPSVAGTYTYYDDVYAFDPSSIIDVGTYTYTVIFNPTNPAYAASLVDLTFTITNASLTLSYSTAPSFAFQTANQLSLLQPTKSVAVDGQVKVFLDSSYTTELTNSTVLAVGTHPLYVRFTPTKNYNVATTTTKLTVTKIPTSLLYATQSSSIVYGTANSAFLNNVITNSIPGTITYYYDNSYNVVANMSDVLDFGTRTIYTRFVPTDSNYTMAYATYTVNVIKNALTLVYPTLSSIQYGATLASSFTAYATFDGSVNYYINTVQVFADTKLNGGTYNLTAKFTPTKPSNFTTSSISVSRTLIVSKQNTEVTYAPANIISGNTFAASMTATVAPDVSGTLRYFNGTTEIFDTTVLPTGNYSINVTFTPTALTNYNSSSITVPVTVLSNIQFTIMTENTQQMQSASNNQVVSLVTQNELLPPTLDVKVNVLPPGQTSFVSTLTSSTVKKLQFDLVDGSLNSNIRIVAAPLTVNVPGASNSPAIFFKMYDENGNSIVSKDKKVSLTLDLPQYKGLTQFLYLLRMQEVGTEFDGTKVPLTSVNPSDPQNTSFTALFSSNSVYVGAVVPPAPNNSEGVMVSNMYTFSANGGFVMQRGFEDIKLREETPVETYDVTDSVQILFDVATFNAKLGLIKNPTNTSVIVSQFNAVTDQFEADSEPIDSITLSSTEFKTGLVKAQQIISVGRYSSLYSDFKNYVSSYFGFDGGFSSLFVAASEFSIDDDNHFDSASMLSLLTGATSDASGAYISDLSGSITVVNVTKSLRHAVNTNCFGNRSPTTGGTAVDPANISNYGVADGFVAGDLVWVNTGTLVKLNLNIDTEGFNPVNNVGPQNSLTQITNYSSGNFSRQTTATTTNINRTVRAPLLLKLVDASTISALQ